jgi:3-oxoacyl-[acyl-carrier protein] reductase
MNILITGGASGLGEAITRFLAKDEKNTVYFTFANSEVNAKKIESELTNTHAIKCDFSNEESLKLLIEKIIQLDLDVLINNAYAGEPIKTYFHKMLIQDFEAEFRLNIIPTIFITQAVIQNFRKVKKGKIITILTSYLLNVPPIGASGYVATKSYLGSLVKSWANENIKFNITSNSVSPSFMQTGLTSSVDERIIEQMVTDHPLKRLLTSEEVAATVSFLIHSTSHINGIDLTLNAGTKIK